LNFSYDFQKYISFSVFQLLINITLYYLIVVLLFRVFWNEYYLADDYPRENFPVPFTLPIVQDPAIPTHNVASTGLEDWAQFRRELSKWVAKLTL